MKKGIKNRWIKINIDKAIIEEESSQFLRGQHLSGNNHRANGNFLYYYVYDDEEYEYLLNKYSYSVVRCPEIEIPKCLHCNKKMDNNTTFPEYANNRSVVGRRMSYGDERYGKYIHKKCLKEIERAGYKPNNSGIKLFCEDCNMETEFKISTNSWEGGEDDGIYYPAGSEGYLECKRCSKAIYR